MNPPAFTVRLENGGLLIEIPWNARTAGRVLISLSVLGAFVFTAIQLLEGVWWGVAELVSNGLIVAVLAYLGIACLRNHTRVQRNPDGSVLLSYGPQPLFPSIRIAREDLARVQAYLSITPGGSAPVRKVDLITKAGRRHPLRVGGYDSQEEATSLEQSMRDFLQLHQLPAAP